MDYGNKIVHLKRLGILCLIIGVPCYPLAATGAALTGLWGFMPWRVVGYVSLAPAICLLLPFLPTMLFCIRIKDGIVQHLFLKRFVINQKRLEDLLEIKISNRQWAAVLVFRSGSKIRFWGAHFDEIGRLVADLKELTKGKIIVA